MAQELPKRKEGESALDYLNRVKKYWEDQEKWDKVAEVAERIVSAVRKGVNSGSKKAPKKEKEAPKEEGIELQRPVRREDESLAEYLQRLKEWKRKVKEKGLRAIGDKFDL